MSNYFFAILFTWALSTLHSVHASEASHKITVTGECEIKSEPDRLSVILKIEEVDPDSKRAYSLASEKAEKLKTKLKGLYLDQSDLSTLSFDLSEKKEWENQQLVSKGYEARVLIQVTTNEQKQISKILEVATDQKIKGIERLSYSLSFDSVSQLQNKCLRMAVHHAEEKAKTMLQGTKAQLGELLKITELAFDTPTYAPLYSHAASEGTMKMMASPQGGSQNSAETNLITVKRSVIVEYKIKS